MGYTQAYLDLLSRGSDRQANTLRDLAQITANAQIQNANVAAQTQRANAQVWGALPGQLAGIGVGAINTYLDDKQKTAANQTAARRVDIEEARAQETARANEAREDRMAGVAESEAAAKERAQTLEMFKFGAPGFGSWLRDAASSADRFAVLRNNIEWASNLGKDIGLIPPDIAIPASDDWTPQLASDLTLIADALDKNFGPKPPDPGDRYKAIGGNALDVTTGTFLTPPAQPKEVPPPTPGTLADDIARFVATNQRQPTQTEVDALRQRYRDTTTRPPSAAAGGAQLPATGFVMEAPPEGKDRNALAPGGTLTQKAVWDQAENYILTGEKNYNQRAADAKERNNAANIINTASARINDESSLPLLRSTYKSLSGSQQQMTKAYLATSAFVDSARRGIRQAEALSDTYKRSDVPKLNEIKRWWDRNISGDPNLSGFEVFVYNTVRDYGKATSGSAQSIAQMTDAQIKAAEMLLGTAHTPAQFKAAVSALDRDMVNILDTQRERIAQTQTEILGLLDQTFGVPEGAGAKPQAPTGRVGTPSASPTATPPSDKTKPWNSPRGLMKWNGSMWVPA